MNIKHNLWGFNNLKNRIKKTKQPGINFKGVYLTKLNFDMPKVGPKDFKYDIDFEVRHDINPSQTKLMTILHVTLYKNCYFDIVGVFFVNEKERNVSLKQFAEHNAPALLIPFAREIIHNLTSKTMLPTLLLPPINLVALMKAKYRAKKVNKRNKK